MLDPLVSARPDSAPAAGGDTALASLTPHRLGTRSAGALLALLLAGLLAPSADAASLRGTKSAMNRQYAVARVNGMAFARTAADVYRSVDLGVLVRVQGNADYELDKVSYPFCRPETRAFIERLAHGYRTATGEKLVITSLTRPTSEQPRNASDLSVHPAGMAVDFRRSNSSAAQRWIERELLAQEREGLVDATKERRPPHYHVAVFPGPQPTLLAQAEETPPDKAPATRTARSSYRTHKVRRGESLWVIAQRYDCSVRAIKSANSMGSNRLRPGQLLRIPAKG